MPINPVPIIITMFLCLLPLAGLLVGRLRGALIGGLLALATYAAVPILLAWPYWKHVTAAKDGDASAMYEAARWYEWYCWNVQQVIVAPCLVDRRVGFDWLVQSAKARFAPAMYALGVRLKYKMHLPDGIAREPGEGQALIDAAIAQGYLPHTPERMHYAEVYRR